jgi:hypothetical protein
MNATEAFIGLTIQSESFETGVAGWRINKDGDVEFNSGTFRGTTIWTSISGAGKPADGADVTPIAAIEAAYQAYAVAQDELEQIRADAYSDGIVTAEEERAILDATTKANAAQAAALVATQAWSAEGADVTPTTRLFTDATTRANIEAWRKAGSPTYLDGSHIYAQSIVAGSIAANAITAVKVGTNEIIANAANIKNGVITNAKIGSLNAGKITAGSLHVDRIVAGSIKATKIYSSAYLGGKQLTNYAYGSFSSTAGTHTITHNLGRYAIVSYDGDGSLDHGLESLGTSSFGIWLSYTGGTTHYAYI